MSKSVLWTRLLVDGKRCLVYGPILGRSYLLPVEQSLDPAFLALLGLRNAELCDDLLDPAYSVIHQRSHAQLLPQRVVPTGLKVLYRLIQATRNLISIGLMVSIIVWLAKIQRKKLKFSASDIGLVIYNIERSSGLSDCYPRALLTCYLCLRSGLNCDLVVGSLVPTRMMHAWCSSQGLIPYEPSPEHWMYRPLVTIQLSND